MGNVRVNLLSGFAATVDGAPVPEGAWRLRKARELVKLLALAPGHRVHREQAMDVLWRDREPSAAANNLHQAVHAARRALDAAAIEVRDEVLRLEAEVDVDELELAAAQARRSRTATAYRAALALYTGELLPENRYDDWAEDRRDELGTLAAELADELDALGGGDDRSFVLPADASSFVGRERELSELKGLLRRTRLLTLAGTGGAGKTRLGLELARAAGALVPRWRRARRARGPDRLRRRSPGSCGCARRAGALRVRRSSTAVIDFLAPRSQLLLLDNCEHLLAAVADLADRLLRAAPGLTILATSREPLHVAGEVVFRVPSLGIPDPDQVLEPEQLLGYEAVRLFAERAGASAPGFALDDANAADVARICFRLDGLPLALELAAGRVGALDPGDIAARLDDRFRLLRKSSHASPTRQHTLRATLQWSHDLLTDDERTLFRRLAVFAGSFDLAAVERVCAGGELDSSEIADVLGALVEKSLVSVDEPSEHERRVPPARHRSPLRAGAAARVRRDGRARRASCPLGARARRGRSCSTRARP